MRKPAFCICENKDAVQLRGNREADQRLCFRYTDSTIPLLYKSKFQASSHLLWLYSLVCVGPGQKPQRPVFSQRGSNISRQAPHYNSRNVQTPAVMQILYLSLVVRKPVHYANIPICFIPQVSPFYIVEKVK